MTRQPDSYPQQPSQAYPDPSQGRPGPAAGPQQYQEPPLPDQGPGQGSGQPQPPPPGVPEPQREAAPEDGGHPRAAEPDRTPAYRDDQAGVAGDSPAAGFAPGLGSAVDTPGRPAPASEPVPGAGASQAQAASGMLPWHEAEGYGRRWETIQHSFVDDPRRAVEEADALVLEVLERLVEARKQHRQTLLDGSSSGQATTEDMRTSMTSYRQFFQGLLREAAG